MKINRWMVCGSLIACVLTGLLTFYHFRHLPLIECHSNVRVFDSQGEMKVLFSYSMKNGSGVANIAGTFYGEGKKNGNVSRTVTFTYSNNNNIYTLLSTSVSHSTLDKYDDDFLSHYLPKFYLYQETPLIITITPQTHKGWIFATGKVPSFYCEKNK